MKKRLAITLSAFLLSTSFLSGCGGADGDTSPAKSDFKVGLVTDTGGIDDKAFNQGTWEGLKRFGKEHNLEENVNFRYLASAQESDFVPNLTTFAESNFDLTFGIGFLQDNAITEVAERFPDNHFAIIDSEVNKDNVASILFQEHEGSFLVGVIAAMTTKTDRVGFIGGVEMDVIRRFEYGFRAGVKAVNPDIDIVSHYAGDFNRPELGAQLASAMYAQNVDIIYHAAAGTGNGIFTEAKNLRNNGRDVWVIGVDRDQHEQGLPENVTLTSMVKRVDVAAYDITKKTYEGNFPGGQTFTFGLKDDGVGIAETTENVSEEALKKVEEFREKIINGDIVVPSNREEFENMNGANH